MGKRKRDQQQTLQEFLLDVYTTEKETLLARIRGAEKGLAEVRRISELWTREDITDTEETLTRMRRYALHINALKIVVRKHNPGTDKNANECAYCRDTGQEIDCTYPCDTLRVLGMPYLDYPGYNPDWAVSREQFEDLSLLHGQELHESVELLRQRRESP